MHLLVLNAGSSSLRFQLIEGRRWTAEFKGHVDGIGLRTCRLRGDVERTIKAKNHTEALQIALETLKQSGALNDLDDIHAIGHRVVHGGERYHSPIRITRSNLKALKKLSPLAPLHNPANLQGIEACLKILPKTPNVAVFDTGFHATLPEHAYLYGLPYSLYKKHGIRKYGFHGTSHKYVSGQAIQWLKTHRRPHRNVVTCHMGNGVSVTAVQNGKSIETSMGFTPLEGVMMGTRSGNLDPALPLYLSKILKKSPTKIDHLLNKESGLKGLSQITSDVRPLWAIAQNPKHRHYAKVKRAFDVYTYRLAQTIAGYTASLGGLDALVFTAGIGENAWYLRRDITARLKPLGIQLDSNKNRRTINGKSGPIQKSNTPPVLVIPTNEEVQIAQETAQALHL